MLPRIQNKTGSMLSTNFRTSSVGSADKNTEPLFRMTPEEVRLSPKTLDQIISLGIGNFTYVYCSNFRVGDYKWTIQSGTVKVCVSKIGLFFAMPHAVTKDKMVKILIPMELILSTEVHFTYLLPCIFLKTDPEYTAWIRNALGLNRNSNDGNFYCPLNGADCQKYIAFQPINAGTNLTYGLLRKIFNNKINEVDYKQANSLVVRFRCRGHKKEIPVSSSSSCFTMSQVGPVIPVSAGSNGNEEVLTYHGIRINQLDVMSLGQNQFVNDSIVDLCMRYMEHESLSPEERARTYIFSYFFYLRLTTSGRRRHEDKNMDRIPKAERRHARVKRWTKDVDIFEKDFVFVPIIENFHWFLAVICYPGMIGAHHMTTGEALPGYDKLRAEKARSKLLKRVTENPGMETHSSVQSDSSSDSSYDSSPNSPLSSDNSGNTFSSVAETVRTPIKQPCILIFDSLAGRSRSRIFSTLRDYLTVEYKTRKGQDREFSQITMRAIMPKIPQQPNFCDCGIFVILYAQCFFSHPIPSYDGALKKSMLQEWFNVPWFGREEIFKLIKELVVKNNAAGMKVIPKLTFPQTQKLKSVSEYIVEEQRVKLEALERVKAANAAMDIDAEGASLQKSN